MCPVPQGPCQYAKSSVPKSMNLFLLSYILAPWPNSFKIQSHGASITTDGMCCLVPTTSSVYNLLSLSSGLAYPLGNYALWPDNKKRRWKELLRRTPVAFQEWGLVMSSNMWDMLALTRKEWGTYVISEGSERSSEPTFLGAFIQMSLSDVLGPNHRIPDQDPDFSIRDCLGWALKRQIYLRSTGTLSDPTSAAQLCRLFHWGAEVLSRSYYLKRTSGSHT